MFIIILSYKNGNLETIFVQVAQAMVGQGFPEATGRVCERKFRNLKATYRAIKTRSRQTGEAGGPRWPYFALFDDLFRNDAAINPENILEAGTGYNRIGRRV